MERLFLTLIRVWLGKGPRPKTEIINPTYFFLSNTPPALPLTFSGTILQRRRQPSCADLSLRSSYSLRDHIFPASPPFSLQPSSAPHHHLPAPPPPHPPCRFGKMHIEMLPEDIMVDIFSRLPLDSVGKSRCVSKGWKSLLYEANFIKLHLNRSKLASRDELSILLCDKAEGRIMSNCKPSYSIKLKVLDEGEVSTDVSKRINFLSIGHLPLFYTHINSCDGLVLFLDLSKKVWLMNPATRESRKLPTPPFYDDDVRVGPQFISYGIGYDPYSDDYKVVFLSLKYLNGYYMEVIIKIYSVKNGTWKRVEVQCCNLSLIYLYDVVCVNGRLHWLGRNASKTSYVVVAFDLGKEMIFQMPVHSSCYKNLMEPNHVIPYMGVVQGSICLYSYYPEDGDNGINVCIMKEYGVTESWTTFTIKGKFNELYMVYLCHMTEQHLLMLRGYGSKEVVMYNIKEATFKKVVVDGIPHNYEYTHGHVFVESLVSPHPRNQGHGTIDVALDDRGTESHLAELRRGPMIGVLKLK